MTLRLTQITLTLMALAVLLGGGPAPAAPARWDREPSLGQTQSAPAAVEFEGRVYAFVRGLDNGVWLQTYGPNTAGREWGSRWIQVPGGGVIDASLAATTAGDSLYLFAKGMDRHVWVNVKRRGGGPTDGWSGWSRGGIPAGTTGFSPAAAGAADGTVHLFRRADDGLVYSSTRAAGGWSSWQKASPIATSTSPTAAYDTAANRLYLFVVRTDGQVFLTLPGSDPKLTKPCAVTSMGSGFGAPAAPVSAAGPVAAAARERSLTLFHRSGEGRIHALTHNGGCTAWSASVEVGGGGITEAAPAVAPFAFKPLAGGRFLLLVKGLDDGIYYNVVKALRLQAIRVADTDGKNRTRVTPEQVTSWVDYANRVYAGAGIRLVYNPTADFVNLDNSVLNGTNLCNPPWVTTNCIPKGSGNAEAGKYPGKVTVLFRFGGDVDPVSGARVPTGGGWSWNDLNFVVMPGIGDAAPGDTSICGKPNLGLLAHELGHYLGLLHTFTTPLQSLDAAAGFVPAPAVGDVDRDGKDDLIAFTKDNGNDVWVALSTGSTFGARTLWHEGFATGSDLTLVGDFDGDRRADIAALTRGTTGDVSVALSDGKKFGTAALWHGSFGSGTDPVVAGDFDGDDKDDLATFVRSTGEVQVAISTGSGFATPTVWHIDFASGADVPAAGDVDRDGDDDLIVFTRGATGDVFVALSTGRTLGSRSLWHGDFAFGDEVPAVGDVDGDRRADIVAFTRGEAGDVFVARSSGTKFVGTGSLWHGDFAFRGELPVVGDFTGGADDIAAFTRDGTDDVYVARSTSIKFSGTGERWHDDFGFVSAAFDGDGLSDTPIDPYVDIAAVQCPSASTSIDLAGTSFGPLPRDNIMSYYDHDAHTVTRQQIERVDVTLANRSLP